MDAEPSYVPNKDIANLDIAEKRIPQDGRIKHIVDGEEVDMRVSTLPQQYLLQHLTKQHEAHVTVHLIGLTVISNILYFVWGNKLSSPVLRHSAKQYYPVGQIQKQKLKFYTNKLFCFPGSAETGNNQKRYPAINSVLKPDIFEPNSEQLSPYNPTAFKFRLTESNRL